MSVTIDTQHEDMIHDVQLDYYSRRLATCSTDRTIKIFDVNNPQKETSRLTGHDGPVWQVAWAHPKFGVLLASCSYDRSVIIHKEEPAGSNKWVHVYKSTTHQSSVNSVAWAPHQYGLKLACASSDGTASVISYDSAQSSWKSDTINVGSMGCNSISWAPFGHLGFKPAAGGAPLMRLVTGSCEPQVKIFVFSGQRWVEEQANLPCDGTEAHSDWVRDVAWAPNAGMACNTVASCGEDGLVLIHTQQDISTDRQTNATPSWTTQVLHKFNSPVWRVSWSVTGHLLAVSAGDHEVTLWKEAIDGSWINIKNVSKTGAMVNGAAAGEPQNQEVAK